MGIQRDTAHPASAALGKTAKSGSVDCLAIDIGNTRTKVAVVRNGRVTHVCRAASNLPRPRQIESVLREALGLRKVAGAALASVVPAVTDRWAAAAARLLDVPPLIVHGRLRLGIRMAYPHPERLGADRLANVCGAYARYGAPAIVVDFGTAATFDVISARDEYVGGVIAPGLAMLSVALAQNTALLPVVSVHGRCAPVGKTTRQAIQIGVQIGYRGLVREILEYLYKMNGISTARLVITGGVARRVMRGLKGLSFTIDPHLTLRGIANIFELNRLS